MSAADLFARHPRLLQLAFSVDAETGARDLHVWLVDPSVADVPVDPSLWVSVSLDMRELPDPVMRDDVELFYAAEQLDAAPANLIWFRPAGEG